MKTYSEFSGELEESVDESKFADTVKFVPGRNLQWEYRTTMEWKYCKPLNKEEE